MPDRRVSQGYADRCVSRQGLGTACAKECFSPDSMFNYVGLQRPMRIMTAFRVFARQGFAHSGHSGQLRLQRPMRMMRVLKAFVCQGFFHVLQ